MAKHLEHSVKNLWCRCLLDCIKGKSEPCFHIYRPYSNILLRILYVLAKLLCCNTISSRHQTDGAFPHPSNYPLLSELPVWKWNIAEIITWISIRSGAFLWGACLDRWMIIMDTLGANTFNFTSEYCWGVPWFRQTGPVLMLIGSVCNVLWNILCCHISVCKMV